MYTIRSNSLNIDIYINSKSVPSFKVAWIQKQHGFKSVRLWWKFLSRKVTERRFPPVFGALPKWKRALGNYCPRTVRAFENAPLMLRNMSRPFRMHRYYLGESSRGNTNRGATGPRASERENCLWEDLWEGGFQRFFRGFQRFFRGFHRSSERPSQWQISLSEALGPVAPLFLSPLHLSPITVFKRNGFRHVAMEFGSISYLKLSGRRRAFLGNTPSTAGNSMTGSERPSPEPILKKRGVPSRTGGERILEMLWKSQMPWIIGLWGSQPYSWGKFQETLRERFRGLSGFFRKVPAVLGVWPIFSLS